MATINFNLDHFTINGHKANPKDELDGYAIDLVNNLIDCTTQDFTINHIAKTDHHDDNGIYHCDYIIETNISAMDNPTNTIADMDHVLGKYLDWDKFINSYERDWEYQIAGFYDYNDNLVIIFHYEI